MPIPLEHSPPGLSLLEKLTEDAPTTGGNPSSAIYASPDDLRRSVESHLETLLNTRRGELDLDPQFEQTNNSVYNYGILDFNSLVLPSPIDSERLRRSVERAIRLFEPRLARVKVTKDDWDPGQPGLNLEITAELRMDPENETVSFQAFLVKDTRRISVRGGRG